MGFLRRLAANIRPGGARARPGPGQVAGEQVAGQPESVLRDRLQQDPNDLEAFAQLAELVRRRAEGADQPDPLIAEDGAVDAGTAARAAQWALAEELAGNPRAWYPLIELARLSLEDDHEAAMRRLSTACERDRSGRALAEGIKMLRQAGLPAEALALGVGHWAPDQQDSGAGRQVVHAALDAGRPATAREHLQNLATYGADRPGAGAVIAELEPLVAAAQSRDATSRDAADG